MSRTAQATALVGATVAFASLAALTSVGTFTRIDSYALDHLAPGGIPIESKIPLLGELFQYHGHHFDVSQVVRLPGTIVASILLLLIGSAVLWRRGERRALVLWGGAFAVANIVVIVCQETVVKPSLFGRYYEQPVELSEFHMSFPSGHAMRLVLLAALFAYLWRWLRWPLLAWVTAAVVSIQVDHLHTLSDIAGGLVLGCVAILSVVLALDPARGDLQSKRHGSARDTEALQPDPLPLRRLGVRS